MNKFKKGVIVVTLMLLSTIALALPGGWSFHCSGTTGIYSGPNGSYMRVPNHHACSGGGIGITPGVQIP